MQIAKFTYIDGPNTPHEYILENYSLKIINLVGTPIGATVH